MTPTAASLTETKKLPIDTSRIEALRAKILDMLAPFNTKDNEDLSTKLGEPPTNTKNMLRCALALFNGYWKELDTFEKFSTAEMLSKFKGNTFRPISENPMTEFAKAAEKVVDEESLESQRPAIDQDRKCAVSKAIEDKNGFIIALYLYDALLIATKEVDAIRTFFNNPYKNEQSPDSKDAIEKLGTERILR